MRGDDKIKLYGRMFSISLGIILLAFGLFLVKAIRGENTKSGNVMTESAVPTEGKSEMTQVTDLVSEKSDNPLVQDAVFEIHKLMEWFFQAKLDCDIETLQQIVNPSDWYHADRLYEERYGREESGLLEIESYQVESCYSKKGLTEGTYLVWTSVEVKYVNAETPAPALYRMYVCRDGDRYYINYDVSEEEAAYCEEVSAMEDVQELVASVNQRFQEVWDQDEQLKKIVLIMEGKNLEENPSSEQAQQAE